MTTTTAIARSGPAIRAALMQWSPEECEQFEAEFREAAQAAGERFDVAPLDAILDAGGGSRTSALNR